MKKRWFLFWLFALPLCIVPLSTCSIEEARPPRPFIEEKNALDPAKFIVPSIIAPKKEATRGTPIDTVTQMVDFSFFCSYTNQITWSASNPAHTFSKMFNRQMLPYYDLAHTYPNILLWDYATLPKVLWETATPATAADHYTFFGYSPYATGDYNASTNPNGNGLTVTSLATSHNIPTISYNVPLKVENQPDFMLARPVYDLVPTGHPVEMHLNHALTAIGFRIAGKFGERITQLSVTGVYVAGNLTMDGSALTVSSWTLTGGKTSANFTASINFDAGQSYRTVTSSFTNPLKNDGWLMMPPQTLDGSAKVIISLADGTTREVGLTNNATTVWEPGKRILYDIFVTPAGSIMVLPGNTQLPYMAQSPANEYLSVVCEQITGSPDPTPSWTLTVDPAFTSWLRLSLNPSGASPGTAVSGTGTQTVYLVTLSGNYDATYSSRTATLSLTYSGTTVPNAATVTQAAIPGPGFLGWLYVKQGSTGTGLSWNNALPTINAAISLAAEMRTAGITPLHGILVAGGSSRLYAEPFILSGGTRIFGGWEGVSGTELANTANAPYTSSHRNLSAYKAIVRPNPSVALPGGGIILTGAGDALDGFIVKGATTGGAPVIVNTGAYIHAVEITSNITTVANTPALSLRGLNAKAINVLVTNNSGGPNNGGIQLAANSKLINATVVGNSGLLESAGGAYVHNSVVWNNGIDLQPTDSIKHSAFPDGFLPSGLPTYVDNIPINTVNTAWFTTSNVVPGPHFAANATQGKPYYSAMNNRAPMLGRGNQTAFTNNTSGFIPTGNQTDIDGNPRNYLGIDMGCYEDGVFEGFKLRWAADRMYISSKNGAVNEIPLLLPDNETTQIGIQWSVSVVGSPIVNNWTLLASPPSSGAGTGVVVGVVNVSTNDDYTYGGERQVGTLLFSTNLGAYLPNEQIQLWQIPGTNAVWENGYVGSFHRNNETSERYIVGENSYGYFASQAQPWLTPTVNTSTTVTKGYYTHWSARIVSGLDWIKIDTNPKGHNGGDVIETPGGVVSGTTPVNGNMIRFRVGLKSTLPHEAPPRYGLIVISRGNSPGSATGAAFFFVRQGEEPDYLYRPTDPHPNNRNFDVKFSPYNLVVQNGTTVGNGGVNVGARGGQFTDYPTKVGDFYQRNNTIAYRRGIQSSNLPSGQSSWSDTREVCPPGYRTPLYGNWIHSLYSRLAYTSGTNQIQGGTDTELVRGFLWGFYADGYFDQIAPDPMPADINTSTVFQGSNTSTAAGIAAKGILMVNFYNYGSIFFPQGGTMTNTAPTGIGQSYPINNVLVEYPTNPSVDLVIPSLYRGQSGQTAMYPSRDNTTGVSTHWVAGHVGMACTNIANTSGSTVRCVVAL